MPGTPIQQFNDFMTTTGPSYLSGPDNIVNLALANTYILGDFLRGRSNEELMQAGQEIRETMMFDEQNTMIDYYPNENVTYSNPQVLEEISLPWRFSQDHMTWTEQELILNGGGSGVSRNAQFHRFKTLKRIKYVRVSTSIVKGLEERFLRVPIGVSHGPAQMEAKNGKRWYSLLALNNAETNGLYSGWTTKHTLDPAVLAGRWSPQWVGYNPANILNDTADGLLRAFDDLALRVNFVPPQIFEGDFEPNDPRRQTFYCSRDGLNNYRQALRVNGDDMASRADPAWSKPVYNGCDLKRVARFDTMQAWDNGTQTEATAATPGARYMFINANYLRPVFHSEKYLSKDTPMRRLGQTETWVCPTYIWGNILSTAMNRLGGLYPSA